MLTRSKSLLNGRVLNKNIDVSSSSTSASSSIKINYANQMRNYFIKEASKLKETKVNSVDMKRYMRDQFDFIGLKQPARKSILKEWLKTNGEPSEEDLLVIYKLPEREFTYCAIEMAESGAKKAKPERLSMYIDMALHKSWWDTIDCISSRLVGVHLLTHKNLIDLHVDDWLKHESFWIKRIAILFQLKYKKQTDIDLLFKCIDSTINIKEFFIEKAIGWSLREYAKTDKNIVKGFVESRSDKLSVLSKKEATKHF